MQKVAGAYRLGFGNEIMREQGIKGFYVSTLFRFEESFGATLEKTIELGRSFINVEYQREVLPLVLLFRGLRMIVDRYPEMTHFIGPVSISPWYPKFFQSMIVHYVTEMHPVDSAFANLVHPSTPFQPDFLKADPEVLMGHQMERVEKFDRYMYRLSNGRYRLPTMFKQYLKLNAKFLCFNVDPDFNNTLDALLFLRIADLPKDDRFAPKC